MIQQQEENVTDVLDYSILSECLDDEITCHISKVTKGATPEPAALEGNDTLENIPSSTIALLPKKR
jgi:hypothetical protein